MFLRNELVFLLPFVWFCVVSVGGIPTSKQVPEVISVSRAKVHTLSATTNYNNATGGRDNNNSNSSDWSSPVKVTTYTVEDEDAYGSSSSSEEIGKEGQSDLVLDDIKFSRLISTQNDSSPVQVTVSLFEENKKVDVVTTSVPEPTVPLPSDLANEVTVTHVERMPMSEVQERLVPLVQPQLVQLPFAPSVAAVPPPRQSPPVFVVQQRTYDPYPHYLYPSQLSALYPHYQPLSLAYPLYHPHTQSQGPEGNSLVEVDESPKAEETQVLVPQPVAQEDPQELAYAEQTAPSASSDSSSTAQVPVDAGPVQNNEYNFEYRVYDSRTGTSHGHTQTSNGHVVSGRYVVMDPDGHLRTVSYTSDPVYGFNALVDRQPLPSEMIPQVAPLLHRSLRGYHVV